MKTITYATPAKIHLMGEHSVVFGKPALLAAIDKHITVSLSSDSKNPGLSFASKHNILKDFQKIIEESVKTHCKIRTIPPYAAIITSDIPIGAGLGSSAALSTAFTAALLSHLHIKFNNALLFKIAYEGERFFHGNPSGGDLAVVIEGGLLYFRKEFEFLKSFSNLDFEIKDSLNNFFIINSGKPNESTLDMVKKVGKLKNSNTQKIDAIFENQEIQTKNLVIALKESNENLLKDSIKDGEANLEKLDIVGKNAQKIIRGIEKIGGVAKISGGGGVKKGSGIVLCYHNDLHIFKNFCTENNLSFEKIKIVNTGIKKLS